MNLDSLALESEYLDELLRLGWFGVGQDLRIIAEDNSSNNTEWNPERNVRTILTDNIVDSSHPCADVEIHGMREVAKAALKRGFIYAPEEHGAADLAHHKLF